MKSFFILSLLLCVNICLADSGSLTKMERLSLDAFWTACGIEKYCLKENFTAADESNLNDKEMALRFLPQNITCDGFLRKVSEEDTLNILKATLLVRQQDQEPTCLSKVKELESIH